MVRSVAKKVAWVGRTASMVFGLALVLALLFGVASTALGANGGNFILGSLNNTATAITKLTGTVGGGPALQVSNPSTATGSTALDLQVATGKAPMKVNRTTKVTNLNSDQVDGKSAANLIRVASFSGESPLTTGIGGTVATTTINAPSPGFLVIDAGVENWNFVASGVVRCHIRVDNVFAHGSQRFIEHNVAGGNRDENCSTNTVVPVPAGTHTVDLLGTADSSGTNWGETALSAIYVPFNGTGASPSSAAVSAAQEEPQAPESRK
jgi:hypothetical protein